MLSYKCPATCRHCMYACSPHWSGDWITKDQLESYLPQLATVIQPSPHGPKQMSLNHGLHFSGGEPFLNFERLLQAVEIADNLNIPSTFVETNCFWCRNDAITRERLIALKKVGLRGILISVNPYYAEYVPFERTDRCVGISLEVFGQNVAVYQLAYYHQFKQLGVTGKLSINAYRRRAHGASLSNQVELFLMGRATEQLQDLYPKYPPERFFKIACQPDFIRSWHNHFDNYGNFMPGYCGGISLGSWFELNRLVKDGIDLDRHPVLNLLIHHDMQGLFEFASGRGYQARKAGYVSKCHLCLDIRKMLVTQDEFKELKPIQFYQQIDATIAKY